MKRLQADVEALNTEVRRLREELSETERVRDLHERIVSSSASKAEEAERKAEEAHALLRRRVLAVAAGLTAWALLVAYCAIWWHEQVRNNCYPVAAIVERGPVDEPWYCGMFPGPNRHAHEEVP